MTDVTPDPKGKPARKRRKTAAEQDRELLAQGQRDEQERKAQRAAARSTTPSGGESVSATLSRLRTTAAHPGSSNDVLAAARMEAKRLGLMAGTSAADRRDKIVAQIDKRLGATDTKPEPVVVKPGEKPSEAVKRTAAERKATPAKAKPTTKVKLPAKVTDVKGHGEPSTPDASGQTYTQVPFKAEYHGSGRGSQGLCARCDKGADASVLITKPDGTVRAFRSYCADHANPYARAYGIPVPGQSLAQLATETATYLAAEKEKVA